MAQADRTGQLERRSGMNFGLIWIRTSASRVSSPVAADHGESLDTGGRLILKERTNQREVDCASSIPATVSIPPATAVPPPGSPTPSFAPGK